MPARSAPRSARRRPWRRLLALACALAGATFLLGAAGAVGTVAYYSRDLPSLQTIDQRHQFQSTLIYDRNGVLLHEFYDPNRGRRVVVPLRELPRPLIDAFLAAEDARFYHNPGVDPVAIVRAAVGNASGRGPFSGASTITQQLVKNTLLSGEVTLERKIREAILSLQLSRLYSKDEILELYLNSVYLGNQAYGVEAGAQTYFGKSARELTLPEAAVLAGLVRSPSTTNPLKDEGAARAEQRRVLEAMVRHGYLDAPAAEGAAGAPLTYTTGALARLRAPHFVLWIREQLEANPRYGREAFQRDGLEITTSLDVRLQEMAELAVRERVAQLRPFNATNAALVALNPKTGEVLAMVGSADFANKAIQGEVNVARALRQPGSSIKPITYLAAFQKGWSPATVIEDERTEFPAGAGQPSSPPSAQATPYVPRNYDGRFHGKVTVRTALANSYNVPAVKALQFVGIPAMADLAQQTGLETLRDPRRYGLALTLGGGEVRLLDLTSAYGVLAAGGQRVPPVSILKIADRQGRLLDQYAGPQPRTVVDPQRAYLVTSILADNAARTPAFGANSPLRLSRPAAVKTGTTDDFRDNWTIGYTSQLVTGVWVGNADNTPMRGTTGLTGAAPIWHDFMEMALEPLPTDPLEPPPGLERAAVGRDSGRRWTESCPEPKVEDLFVAGTLPAERCEAPTPTPTATARPATPTAVPAPATPTPRASPTAPPRPAASAASATPRASPTAQRTATAISSPERPERAERQPQPRERQQERQRER